MMADAIGPISSSSIGTIIDSIALGGMCAQAGTGRVAVTVDG